MKTYKKVKNKIYSVESVEVEVDVNSIKSRIETLNQAIENTAKKTSGLNYQNSIYENEKADLESDLKEIKKLK